MATLKTSIMSGSFVMRTDEMIAIEGVRRLIFFTDTEHFRSVMNSSNDIDATMRNFTGGITQGLQLKNDEGELFSDPFVAVQGHDGVLLTTFCHPIGERYVSVTYTLTENAASKDR